ncbi:Protein pam71, chloroplastic [Stylosanthes scabra]|uniref:GDT1 family protein n=1 Tax=Stylosanthes scabra TaxID=79078 RepID=A0ABU6Y0U0_9FABA|nr:Protein pam71, chloroplastic [Stylosanthes scabra]
MHSLSHSHSFLRPLASFPSSSHRTSYLTLHSSSSSFISSAIYRTHAPSTTPNKFRSTKLIPSDSYNASQWESHLSPPPHHVVVAPSDHGLSKGLLKFLLLFGFLALGDSNPAFAASDALPFFQDFGDLTTGFASAFLLIFFSELGDKTFFIAALLAARNSGVVVFIGTFGALAAMTLISVVLGRTFHYVDEILPFRFGETDLPVDDIAAVCLLLYFGVSTLVDASLSDGQKSDDEQKEAELAVSEFSGNGAGMLAAAGTVVSTFLLVFVAEWGDKSFFSTIALAAASSPLGVIGGALAGHGAATLLAVLGGSLLGTFLSEKVISYIGGVLFLVFAAVTLFEIVQ